MKITYHKFYEEFHCVASKCSDSCCKEWDVVIDDQSSELYENVGGEFGEKLRSAMITDSDGDRIFTLQNNCCPFWNKDRLCDIYINLGEAALCETCRRFPRIVLNYTSFEERILSLACPEALRLMLHKGAMQSLVVRETSEPPEPCDYDENIMELLIAARKEIFSAINDGKSTIFDCINAIYKICGSVQSRLNGEEITCDFNINGDSVILSYQNTITTLLSLDIMTDEWRALLENARQYAPAVSDISAFQGYIADYGYEYKNLAFYYVFRYFINAIDSYDVLGCFKLLLLAVKSAYVLHLYLFSQSLNLSDGQRHRVIGLYSKEIEQSYENISAIANRSLDEI